MKQIFKNQKIIIPTTLTVVIGFIIAVIATIFLKSPAFPEFPWNSKEPLSKQERPLSEYPWSGCRDIKGYDPKVDYKYNYISTLDITTEKETDNPIIIGKDGQKRVFRLGKFKFHLEPNSIVLISKLWLFFSSEKLSDREDKLYGLEDSYLSKIIFKAGNNTKEVKLGKTGEHSFIELDNCPIGNYDAVDYRTTQEFEFLLEVGCNNFKDEKCFDNEGKPLDHIDGADLSATIRFFVVSMEIFNKDINISTKFKY